MTPTQRLAEGLVYMMQRLRDEHTGITALQVQALGIVAAEPGIEQKDLLKALGCSNGAASRTASILTSLGNRKKDGLGLIDRRENPLDRRQRILKLTPAGERLFGDFVRVMKGKA